MPDIHHLIRSIQCLRQCLTEKNVHQFVYVLDHSSVCSTEQWMRILLHVRDAQGKNLLESAVSIQEDGYTMVHLPWTTYTLTEEVLYFFIMNAKVSNSMLSTICSKVPSQVGTKVLQHCIKEIVETKKTSLLNTRDPHVFFSLFHVEENIGSCAATRTPPP